MSLTTQSLTYDDLVKMPDDGNRYEIIGGVLHVTPAPTPRHQRIVLGLGGRLDSFAMDRGLGTVYPAPLDVRLSPSHVVQPDLVFVRRERRGIVREQFIDGAPDLVVEILAPSTSARDRGEKARLYALFGVLEYWLVDPDARTVTALALQQGIYQALPEEHGVVRSAVLDGFEIDSAAVFATLLDEG